MEGELFHLRNSAVYWLRNFIFFQTENTNPANFHFLDTSIDPAEHCYSKLELLTGERVTSPTSSKLCHGIAASVIEQYRDIYHLVGRVVP